MLKVFNIIRGILALFMLLCILIIGSLVALYFINPTYTLEKAGQMFAPTVNIKTEYIDKTTLEVPIVYELVHVIGSQTKSSQNNKNLLDKSTTYYSDVERHFSELVSHAAVQSLKEVCQIMVLSYLIWLLKLQH